MILVRRRTGFRVSLVILFSIALGCQSQSTPSPAPATPTAEAIAEQLRTIANAGTLADLKYPNFPDYRPHVQALYEAVSYMPVWVRNGQPTPQALAVITAFGVSRLKGLNPEEYDAERWPSRLSALKSAPGDATTIAHFDAALTVSAMRYISDLHIGRVNPKHFKFGIDVAQKSYDLPQFLLQKLLPATDVSEVLKEVEPPYYGYQRTEAALQNYLALADQDHSAPSARSAKDAGARGPLCRGRGLGATAATGGRPAQGPCRRPQAWHLRGAASRWRKAFPIPPRIKPRRQTGQRHAPSTQHAVERSHPATRRRLGKMEMAAGRLSNLAVAVNIPEFVLRVFSPDHRIALRMNVVVGKAVRNETPVLPKT